MPRGDRTGPEGLGPMTGRAGGYCTGYTAPGFAIPAGRGWGGGWGGRGGGWRHRHWYHATGLPGWQRGGGWARHPLAVAPPHAPSLSREQELRVLQQQATDLESTLEEVRQRITALERAPGDE
jgi:hypothetical protein